MSQSFLLNPHRTLLGLAFPVLISLVAEPLTGIADTAFVARLGAVPLAALGAATILISSVFWIFNFLAIGTQTEVAQAWGRDDDEAAAHALGLGLILAAGFGMVFAVVGWLSVRPALDFMGATGEMGVHGALYLRIRLLAAPAVLLMTVAFGALRGRQDMATPLRVAVASNLLNIVLDALLVLGPGPFPALGIAGAAWASVAAQLLAAVWAVAVAVRRIGWPERIVFREALELLRVGRDLVVRTGLLVAFIAFSTRAATRIGPEAGAVHQAIRQIWMFGALLLDAFAVSGQSLVGYFLGRREIVHARRVAGVATLWGLLAGGLLALAMLLGTPVIRTLLVPPEARYLFWMPWLLAALAQPVNALSFVTDGIHWATRDYAYLRNAILLASGLGLAGLLAIDPTREGALVAVWWVTTGWITVRAFFGMVRIWPGIGRAPLARIRHRASAAMP